MATTNSPDLTSFIDLRIYDKDPQDIVEVAIQDLKSRMPTWIPREDNTEVMLIEAIALEVAESVFAINRVPNAIMVVLMKMYGITRDEGAPPTVTVKFRAVDSFSYTVPVGTRLLLSLSGGIDPIVFTTNSAVVIPAGAFEASVTATGDRYTEQANNVLPPATLELLDPLVFVESVKTSTEILNGRRAETDLQWITRGSQRLRRLVDTLAVPGHFTSAALELTTVQRATTIDLYDPAGGLPGTAPGHVSVAVYGAGRLLTTNEKLAIYNDFVPRALANLTLHIIDPTVTTVNITCAVKAMPGFTDAEVKTQINAALSAYLSPASWNWAGTVRKNELIALISNIPSIDYVISLTVPANDLVLSGVAPLARFGTATVTVTLG